MKEIGSFIDIELRKNKEWYCEKKHGKGIARLNSGRAAIYHAFRCLKVSTIYIPYYQCETVREFLIKKHINIRYYHINENFEPVCTINDNNSAILIVNYYGIMKQERMERIAAKYRNVIIDNAQAFFAPPISGCMNVYSARKFVGVPDGAYVIGQNADEYLKEYKQGYSSDTSVFLLQRIEYGCEGKTYSNRMLNEKRIDNEDIKHMSKLTHALLDSMDYKNNIAKRKTNFQAVRDMLDKVNNIDIGRYTDENVIPMVYPLLIEDENLLDRLIENRHFQGHWWSYILDEMQDDTFEYYVSKYIIPITIDQRYTVRDIERICALVSMEGE